MPRILIVGDAEPDRRLTAGLLSEHSDLEIEFAENGTQARRCIECDPPDLGLIDLMMPEQDGLDLVKQIRAGYPQVAVILLTSLGNESVAADALRYGASSFVPKAEQAQRLLATVDQVLARSLTDRGRQRLMERLHAIECSFMLDGDPALVRPLVDFVQQALIGHPLTDAAGRIRLAIAFEEALSNAIYHGALRVDQGEMPAIRAGLGSDELAELVKRRKADPTCADPRIVVEINISPFEAKIVIRDRGAGFDPAVVSRGDGSPLFERGRNRGLTLIRSLADEVIYNEAGNEVTLVKRRDLRTRATNPVC